MTEKPKKTPKEELECPKKYVYDTGIIFECKENSRAQILGEDVVGLLNELTEENEQLKQLAEGNEELLLKVMSYLHDNHYDIWEEVNKECFLKELGDD